MGKKKKEKNRSRSGIVSVFPFTPSTQVTPVLPLIGMLASNDLPHRRTVFSLRIISYSLSCLSFNVGSVKVGHHETALIGTSRMPPQKGGSLATVIGGSIGNTEHRIMSNLFSFTMQNIINPKPYCRINNANPPFFNKLSSINL